MNIKETIEKSDEEFMERFQYVRADCKLHDMEHFVDEEIIDFFHSRDTALVSAYKEELRGGIKKMKIPPKEMQHDLKERCDFERNLTLNKVLDLINKKTEV